MKILFENFLSKYERKKDSSRKFITKHYFSILSSIIYYDER